MNGAAGAFQEESWETPSPVWSAVRIADGYKHTASGRQGKGVETYAASYGYGAFTLYNSSALRYSVKHTLYNIALLVQNSVRQKIWI